MSDLAQKSCIPCEGGVPALDKTSATQLLATLDNWDMRDDASEIIKVFQFKNYYHTIAFINAIAWMAHVENHHPDLEVSYNRVVVHYSTHAINGLSENDFICAAKIDELFSEL